MIELAAYNNKTTNGIGGGGRPIDPPDEDPPKGGKGRGADKPVDNDDKVVLSSAARTFQVDDDKEQGESASAANQDNDSFGFSYLPSANTGGLLDVTG